MQVVIGFLARQHLVRPAKPETGQLQDRQGRLGYLTIQFGKLTANFGDQVRAQDIDIGRVLTRAECLKYADYPTG